MPKMIQIRNVPDAVHRELKIRAVEAGMSLSDYLLGIVRESTEQPTLAQLRTRLLTRDPVDARIPAHEIIREARDSR